MLSLKVRAFHTSANNRSSKFHTGLEAQGSSVFTPVHVINIDIKDNHEEATLGAFLILKLCNTVSIRTYTHIHTR